MAIRKLEDKNIRKILKSGDSYAVTIPIEMLDKLKWREKQKVVVKMKGKSIIVRDWK
ncbi:AbrB/MazE/SpoVT family DNA-binding domain-containing protein [Patescibacteria group bacterium]|nr:AbrB/MazE/SpoVT family DNA-binding domain-containing protein [Patescibacteria group bacterium]